MMKRIHLVRHGKPDFWATQDLKNWVTGQELSVLWQEYTESGILPDSFPSADLMEYSRSIHFACSSDLKRAIESACKLSFNGSLHSDPLFREAEMPHGFAPALKLPLWTWSAIARIVWLFGFSHNCESFTAFRRRSHEAAERLIGQAGQHNEVMLVAHGWLNGTIFYHLKRKGWQANGSFQRQHWGWNVLSFS
jgi:broad specificity phosphatase PhoE